MQKFTVTKNLFVIILTIFLGNCKTHSYSKGVVEDILSQRRQKDIFYNAFFILVIKFIKQRAAMRSVFF